MSLFNSRKKTSRSSRVHRTVRRGGDIQKLHIQVTSPRIVLIQIMRGISKGLKFALLLSLLGIISWGGYRGVKHVFIDNVKYRLQEINLQTNGHLDHARVIKVTDIDINASIFAIDIDDVSARLQALPEVIDCDISRRLPGILHINLTERVPVVWIQCEKLNHLGRNQGGVLADKDGITFPCEGALWETARDLPVIVISEADAYAFELGNEMDHPDAMRALSLVQMFNERKVRSEWQPERVILCTNYSMEAVCNNGTRALFGMYEHDRQMNDFLKINEHTAKTQRTIRHINLIPTKNIPVKFAGGPVLIQPQAEPANH